MHFAFVCLDKPDHGRIRQDNRAAHLDYLQRQKDRVLIAGPLLSDDGERPVGSLLVLDLADRAAAEAFAAGDPYAEAGLFESVAIRPWRQVLP